MQELSIWIIVGLLCFFVMNKIMEKDSQDPIGQVILGMLAPGLFMLAGIARFIWVLLSAWF